MMMGVGLGCCWRPLTPIFSPADLFALGEAGAWYDPSDLSSMTIGRDGSGGAPSIGDVVGKRFDLSGNGNHVVMPADDARPRLLLDAGGRPYLDYDGVNDGWSVNIAGIPDNCSIFTALDPSDSDTQYILYSYPSGYLLAAKSADPSTVVHLQAGSPAMYIDRVVAPGVRSDLHSAMLGGPHVVSIIGANVSSWTLFEFGKFTSWQFAGREYGTIIVDPSDTDATDIANIEAWLAGKSGAVLP